MDSQDQHRKRIYARAERHRLDDEHYRRRWKRVQFLALIVFVWALALLAWILIPYVYLAIAADMESRGLHGRNPHGAQTAPH